MEFTFLPKANLRNSNFARYAIKSPYPQEHIAYKNSGFYYIGKNAANIEKLVKAFKRGYASEALENAKAELKRSLMQEKNIIPEMIFCESHFDLDSMKNFRQFLNNHPALSKIPFVMDAADLSQKKLSQYRKNNVLDEIVFLSEYDEEGLLAKSRFLKKIKSKPNELQDREDSKENSAALAISNICKRIFDIVVSSLVLLIASPLFLLAALAVKIESKGRFFIFLKEPEKDIKYLIFINSGRCLRAQMPKSLNSRISTSTMEA